MHHPVDIPVLLFLVSAGFVAYVLVLYPMLLALRPLRVPENSPPAAPRRLSVIVVVHNGEAWIRPKLQSIFDCRYPPECLQVLVVSDGSTDATEAIAREFAGAEVIPVPRGGKAAALNAGIARATGEILVLTDVRQKLHPDCLKHLVAGLADPSVGAVSAEIVTLAAGSRDEADVGLYWRFDVWVRRRLTARHSTFGANGPCYALRRDLAVPLPPDCILDDVYLPMAAYFRGYRVILDVRARIFEYPTPASVEFHRKRRTLAGLYQILRWYPKLLLPGHPMWFHFLSYKFSRLLLPHALLLNLGAAFLLPGPWAVAAVLCHGFVCVLAAADCRVPERLVVKRATSPARMFVVMMAAAFCAQAIFFMEPGKLWKITSLAVGRKPDGPSRRT